MQRRRGLKWPTTNQRGDFRPYWGEGTKSVLPRGLCSTPAQAQLSSYKLCQFLWFHCTADGPKRSWAEGKTFSVPNGMWNLKIYRPDLLLVTDDVGLALRGGILKSRESFTASKIPPRFLRGMSSNKTWKIPQNIYLRKEKINLSLSVIYFQHTIQLNR